MASCDMLMDLGFPGLRVESYLLKRAVSCTVECRPVPRHEQTQAQLHREVLELLRTGVRVIGIQTRDWLAAAGAEVEGCLCALVTTGEQAQLQAAHC